MGATNSANIPDVVDLGCGNNPRQGAFGVDIRDYPNVDLQRDIRNLPDEWTGCVQKAYASQVLEHLESDAIASVLEEVSRILEPGGEFVFDVPYGRVHNPDPTHETRWYFQTIVYYLSRDEVEKLGWDSETFPDYYADYNIQFEVVERDATVWFDSDSRLIRPLSFAIRQASELITTDKWDALPVVGGSISGQLEFRLRKSNNS